LASELHCVTVCCSVVWRSAVKVTSQILIPKSHIATRFTTRFVRESSSEVFFQFTENYFRAHSGKIRIYIYMCVHIHVCIYIYVYICIHTYIYIYMHVNILSVHTHIYVCLEREREGEK